MGLTYTNIAIYNSRKNDLGLSEAKVLVDAGALPLYLPKSIVKHMSSDTLNKRTVTNDSKKEVSIQRKLSPNPQNSNGTVSIVK